jgi:hypothetical protein
LNFAVPEHARFEQSRASSLSLEINNMSTDVPDRRAWPVLPTNWGVHIASEADGLRVATRDADGVDLRYVPSPLPALPARLVEDSAAWLRHIWATRERSILWLLYLDVGRSTWRAYLPSQMCSRTDVRFDPRSVAAENPAPAFRVAGSLFSCPLDGPDDLTTRLPPFDGLHLAVRPDRAWLHLQAFIVSGGATLPVADAASIIGEDPSRLPVAQLTGRQWLVDEL